MYYSKSQGKWKMLYRDTEDMKKTKIKLWDMKTLMSEMKNTLDRIIGRLDIAEEMISEL